MKDENPDFKRIPYEQRNAKYISVLNTLGLHRDDPNQDQYAAHWDLSEPVEFCLNGFPKDSRNYRKIAEGCH